MSLLSFFNRPRSAPVARERLQLLLAHERTASHGRPDLLELLRAEILQVIAKHVVVDSEKVKVSLDRQEGISTLEIDIEIRTPLNMLSSQEARRKVA
jgi:cell division topological specificity factor